MLVSRTRVPEGLAVGSQATSESTPPPSVFAALAQLGAAGQPRQDTAPLRPALPVHSTTQPQGSKGSLLATWLQYAATKEALSSSFKC